MDRQLSAGASKNLAPKHKNNGINDGMKIVYDAFVRTVVAAVVYELVSYPLIKLANTSVSARVFDVLLFAVPVFVAMLIYDIIKMNLNKQGPGESK